MYTMMVILHDRDHCEQIASLLMQASGRSLVRFEGTGFGRTTAKRLFSYPSFSANLWKHLRTRRDKTWVFLTPVPDLATVDRLIEEIEEVVGGLTKPRTGIVCVIPVEQSSFES